MTRITLLSAVAALAITPAAIAQSANIPDEPDGAFMADSPTRLSGLVQAEGLPEDAVIIKTESSIQTEVDFTEPVKPEEPVVYNEDRDIIATGIKPNETPDMYLAEFDQPVTDTDKLAQVFYAMDLNEDGVVARSEWAEWQSDSAYAARFGEFSTDGDDILTLDEYRMSVRSTYAPESMTN